MDPRGRARSLRSSAALCAAAAIVAVSHVPSETAEISPDLQRQLNGKRSDERVPVIIVMSEQTDPARHLEGARSLTRRDRRVRAERSLRANADRTQARVRHLLEERKSAGRVANVRRLWISNAILAEVDPATIHELASIAEIRTLLWDPPIRDEIAHDVGEIVPTPTSALAENEIWQLETINAPAAWRLGYEGEGVVIAIQDSGVDGTHPDLASHLWVNEDEIPDNGIDDDGNGFVDDTWGWDFASGDNDPSPVGGIGTDHGTKCAGIAAGDGTAGTRTGVAPRARIMSCRVSSWGQNVEGIQYAIENGAHIISMSRSESWSFDPRPDYDWWRSVTDGELLAGVFHANSAGNAGNQQNVNPIPFNVAAPACCPSPWRPPGQPLAGVSGMTAACGAIKASDDIANISSRGPFVWENLRERWPEYPFAIRPTYRDYPFAQGGLTKPDLVAPGPGTLSTAPGGGYGSFSGTSAAAPHVAGAMALVLNAHPYVTPAEMAMVLQTSAIDLGEPGKDNTFGAGKLDCLGAVTLAASLQEHGVVQGRALDAETNEPISGVRVEVVNGEASTRTDHGGRYLLGLREGAHLIRYELFGYEPIERSVSITLRTAADLDVQLVRLPRFSVVGKVVDVESIEAVGRAQVLVDGTPLLPVTATKLGKFTMSSIPTGVHRVTASRLGYQPRTLEIDLTSDRDDLYFYLAPALIGLSMETDPGWRVGAPGDDATTGIWERVNPIGTSNNLGRAAQPEDDHSVDGRFCWVTGQSNGPSIGSNDVDGGRTTLRTAVMDLSAALDPVIRYWVWYSNDQGHYDDEWLVQISDDGGESWVDLVRQTESRPRWVQYEHRVRDTVTPSHRVVLQFVASDEGSGSIVEAAVDDFEVFEAASIADRDPTPGPRRAGERSLRLGASAPNPFHGDTRIEFSTLREGPVAVRVFDVSGRLVRTLLDEPGASAGWHAVRWDGRDRAGARSASGVYLVRLQASGEAATKRVVLVE